MPQARIGVIGETGLYDNYLTKKRSLRATSLQLVYATFQ